MSKVLASFVIEKQLFSLLSTALLFLQNGKKVLKNSEWFMHNRFISKQEMPSAYQVSEWRELRRKCVGVGVCGCLLK